jgi:hypothetical protein
MTTPLFRVTLCMVIPLFVLTVSGPQLESAGPNGSDDAAVDPPGGCRRRSHRLDPSGSAAPTSSCVSARPPAEVLIILPSCGPAGEFSAGQPAMLSW